ncbi:glycosyltransferase family 2 protein [candidate division WOR-3 bacterium]|nr:glycosyltransferase family 2 protein [candidate division WOR-3 bacterium]
MSKNTLSNGISTEDFSREVAVVIPAFNEETAIGGIVKKIRDNYNLTVCVVDDASTDLTSSKSKEQGAVILKSEKNMGKGASIIRGMNWAAAEGYKGAVLMDGDGQHIPDEISVFLKALGKDFDCIIVGVRKFCLKDMPLPRIFSNKSTSLVCSILSKKRIRDSQCGFRYLSCGIFKELRLKTRRFQTETEILIRAARKKSEIREVEVSTHYGDEVSHINPTADTLRFLKLITMFISES